MKSFLQFCFRGFYPLFFFGCLTAPTAFGMESSSDQSFIIPESQSGFKAEAYEVKAGVKLERGLQNLFLARLEIPQGVKEEYADRKKDDRPAGIGAFMMGTIKGSFNAIKRTVVGGYEIATFPFPQEPILLEFDEWLY
ncbi:MAG: hypothetical protein EXS63_03255 [Candidatus Omnitrophica bacterium]|nr:hypothetical protein [Candidatus Omnitrophota bacterium]